jgi:hypothetical protein
MIGSWINLSSLVRNFAAVAFLVASLVGAYLLLSPPSAYRPLVPPGGWLADNFFPNDAPYGRPLPAGMAANPSLIMWRSWSHQQGAIEGHLESQPFPAAPYMAFAFSGSPGETPQSQIGLRCVPTGAIRVLNLGYVHTQWAVKVIRRDPAFCDGLISLFAKSGPAGFYVGVSTPFETDWKAYATWGNTYTLPTFALLAFACMGATILAIATLLPSELTPAQRFIFSVTATAACGMPVFLAFQFSPHFGHVFSIAVFTASLAGLTYVAAARQLRFRSAASCLPCLGASLLLMIAYIAFVAAIDPNAGPWTINGMFRPVRWSTDNLLPGAGRGSLLSQRRPGNDR